MKRVAAVFLCGLWLLAAVRVSALQFGDIEVGSLRGEPLLARVSLSDLPENAERELAVGLADASDFSRAGLEYPSHLDSLEFRLVADGEEPAHVMIAGRDPVDAPFVSLLIEGAWSGGRVLHEYTIVLDAVPARAPGTYGPVRAVDTLWSLASRFRPEGISVQCMMLAMLALNPHAFSVENVNALRAGAVLEIPTSERIGVDDKSSATDEVRRQNDAWQVHLRPPVAGDALAESALGAAAVAEETAAAAPPVAEEEAGDAEASENATGPELRVVAPGSEETTSTQVERKLRTELGLALEEVASGRRQLTDTNARLNEAERLIEDLQRLVELKDDDIADLQRRLSDEADAAAQARREASAQAQAAARAQAQAQAQAEAADAARRQAEIEAEAAARAREEARVQAEAAAEARAELELAQAGTAAGGQGDEGREDGEALTAAADAGIETAPLDEEGEPGTEDGAAPSLLTTLEGVLGFSPVVGGVGLVGLILILGGLIALMRRRRSSPEDAAEDDFASREDEDSELREDESPFDDESAEAHGGDTSATEASRGPKSALRPADDELDVDHFDIGIDLDDELARSLDEEPDTGPHLAGGSQDGERALSSPRDSDRGRLPAGSAVDSASMALRDRAAGSGEGSSRGFEDPSLADLVESPPESDDGRGGVARGTWPDRDATEPASGVRDAGAGQYGAALLGPGREAHAESRAEPGAAESLAGDIDELQTKLDLAQTYIDMEDYDDARALLREVQAEGDLEQRAIARYLAGKLH